MEKVLNFPVISKAEAFYDNKRILEAGDSDPVDLANHLKSATFHGDHKVDEIFLQATILNKDHADILIKGIELMKELLPPYPEKS